MFVKQFLTGGDRNFGYLVADEVSKKAAIIDPSYSPDMLVEFTNDQGYTVEYVFNTHGHYDHSNGNKAVKKLTGKTALLLGDTDPQTGIAVTHDARFPLGDLEIVVLHTPGHTEGSVSYIVEVDGKRVVFSGDAIYDEGQVWDVYSLQKGFSKGGRGIGGYHGFMGDRWRLVESLGRIKDLGPDLVVPSHGNLMEDPARAIDTLVTRFETSNRFPGTYSISVLAPITITPTITAIP